MISLSFLKKADKAFDQEFDRLMNLIMKTSGNSNFILIKQISSFLKRNEFQMIKTAYNLSAEKHKKQKRASGKPYFTHLFETALILAGYGADNETIAAALLHDILEDTNIKHKKIKELFSEKIYLLVKGVTKLSRVSKKSRAADLYFKRMFVASAKDVRVLVIKLADKLHNIRTLSYLEKPKRERIAKQALEVYVPLAHKLGLHEIEHEMQERCFKCLMPEEFTELKKVTKKNFKEAKLNIQKAIAILKDKAKKEKKKYLFKTIKKDLYSVYRKKNTKELNQMHDFYTLIILTNTVRECYDALGLLHSVFLPLPRKLKDFIAIPTMDTYQSIHTTVIGPTGKPLKVYIRTKAMHELARKGVIYFFNDKEKLKKFNQRWREIASIAKYSSVDSINFLEALKSDVLCLDIDVYDYKGKHFKMPCDSTVLDFAYTKNPRKASFLLNATVNDLKTNDFGLKLKSGDIIKLDFALKKQLKKNWPSKVLLFDSKQKIKKDLKKKAKQKNLLE